MRNLEHSLLAPPELKKYSSLPQKKKYIVDALLALKQDPENVAVVEKPVMTHQNALLISVFLKKPMSASELTDYLAKHGIHEPVEKSLSSDGYKIKSGSLLKPDVLAHFNSLQKKK